MSPTLISGYFAPPLAKKRLYPPSLKELREGDTEQAQSRTNANNGLGKGCNALKTMARGK
jgi:hypothetical protein